MTSGAPPLISLAVPTFNGARHLRQALDSILDQDYPHVEVLVQDAASTDGTADLLRSYGSRPRLHWVSEPDSGQSDAINRALARARGDLFYWVNSDDYLEPGCLAAIAQAWLRHGRPDVLLGRWRKFDDHTGETTGEKGTDLKPTAEGTVLIGMIGQGVFYRTEIFRQLGGVRPDYHCAMDVHLWLQYLVRFGLRRARPVPVLVSHFRQHPASKTHTAAHRFRHEIHASLLDLFTYLGAPAYLTDRLSARSPLLPPRVDWRPGPHFRPRRLFALACDKWVRLYYRDEAYRLAARWLRREFACHPVPSPALLRFAAKIAWHRWILRDGFSFD